MAQPPLLGDPTKNPPESGQRWRLQALGPLTAWVDGVPVTLGGRKQRTVLALLVLRAEARVSADNLVEAVWGPGASTSRWQRTLQVYVANLRGVLHLTEGQHDPKAPTLTRDGNGYRLALGAADCDVTGLRVTIVRGRGLAANGDPAGAADALRRALDLWTGPAFEELVECSLVDAELAELAELRATTIEDLIDLQLALGRHAEVLPELAGLAAEYPLRERLRAQQMTALYRCGLQAEALEVFRSVKRLLLEELGVDPTPDLCNLEQAILRQDSALNPPRQDASARLSLPDEVEVMLGREAELRQLCALLEDPRNRVVTVHGPGGVGKTRLATAAAHRMSGGREGAYWVDLAPVTDAKVMLHRIAEVLDVPAPSLVDPGAAVQTFLARRSVLLVLDNLEQVRHANRVVADMVANSPGLTVLVTSRVLMRLSMERGILVGPLAVPGHSGVQDADLRRFPAVMLFEQRARASRADFALSDDELPSVVELCRRLDGLPLAIELAAARIMTLSAASLLDRLGRRLDLLSGGAVDMPTRQRTLRMTFEWSHELLVAEEQTLFRRLAVFCDSVSVEDIEQVCAPPGPKATGALDNTEALVRHNLLAVAGDLISGAPRFSMLQTVRQFAYERLRHARDLEPTRRRHAEHITHILASELRTLPTAGWLASCRRHQDDVRAALQWSIEPGHDPGVGLRLVATMEKFWAASGLIQEGQQWCQRVLDEAGTEADPLLRGAALNSAGTMAWVRGEIDRARDLHTQALELQLHEGDMAAVAWSRCCVAVQFHMEKRWEEGDALNRQALIEALSSGADRVAGTAMMNLAVSARSQGRLAEAEVLLQEALARVTRTGDDQLAGLVLGNLSGVAIDRGHYEEAVDYTLESLQLRHALNDVQQDAFALSQLVQVRLAKNDPLSAARWLGSLATYESRTGDASVDTDVDFFETLRAQAFSDGGVAAAAAFLEGQALDVSDAVTEATAAARSRRSTPAT